MEIPASMLFVLVAIGGGFVVLLGVVAMVKNFYRKVEQGQALIVNELKDTRVAFTGGLVIPVIHRAEVMDISLKTIEIDRRGTEGLICQDNIRADIKVTFFVRVNKTEDDVLKVAQAIGCDRASRQETVEELFSAKFSEALKTVGYGMDFVELYNQRDRFKDHIIEVIGTDLNGYVLEDAAIDFLEQTPLESLDNKNILDAQGIRKITELTVDQSIRTNEFENLERKQIKKQDVEAAEAILALERQESEAQAKQKREVATITARERAETERVVAEERQKAQTAAIKADEEIAVANENKERQVQVAQKNRERVVAVEAERVEKDRALEAIAREREVELQRIEKEKALEVEKKEIADVVRTRVAVDKTVAEEEERIKDLRVTAEANRLKEQKVINAEAEAQEALVKDIKAAEAAEKAASHKARERLVLAEAALEAADKEAKANIRLADGTQATEAAQGLAEARVKEADALATEKQGMARIRVKEADAAAILKVGQSEAEVKRTQMEAEAAGQLSQGQAVADIEKQQGMAKVEVREADAAAIEKQGMAEAKAIEEKLRAEAAGLAEKASAMQALDSAGKEHEEFRIRLEKEKEVELQGLQIQQQIAEAQARLLAEAFKNARFDIVGGDGAFFDRFVNAISVGKSIDGFMDRSDTAKDVFREYKAGDRSLPQDVTDILSRPSIGSGDIQRLTVSAFLGGLMRDGDDERNAKIKALAAEAEKRGLGDLLLGDKRS